MFVCLQIEEFINNPSQSNGSLNVGDRRVLQNISWDLNAALKLQSQNKKPIPPQDLKTVAKFVKVVAE